MVEIAKLCEICTYKKYTANEIIFNEGDPGEVMYIILEGSLSVYINSVDGVLLPVSQLQQGDFFGEMSLLEKAPRSATVQANENTTLLLIYENNFENVICSDPNLATKIMRALSKRLRNQTEKVREQNIINHQNLTVKIPDLPGNTQTEEQENTPNTDPTDNPEIDTYQFFLSHSSYDLTVPTSHVEYLFLKKVTCPVCGKPFETIAFHSSKLNVKKVDPDFRRRYLNFDPLWYSIWVCPHCYYANLTFEFEQLAQKAKKAILDHKDVKQSGFEFSSPRRVDQIFRAYYLAIYWVETLSPDSEKLGKLWLRLAWLYEDVGDNSNSKMARRKSLNYYKDSNLNSNKRVSAEQTQFVSLLMGELALKTGQRDDALQYFGNSIVRKGGNQKMNEQARARLLELKEKE